MATAPGFEPLPQARYTVETIDGVPWIVARAGRNWFTLPFFALWLTLWTMGMLIALSSARTSDGPIGWVFPVFALLIGWGIVGTSVIWQLAGRARLTVEAGALLYRWEMPLIGKTRRYDASQVRHLRASEGGLFPFGGWGRVRNPYPPFFTSFSGSVQFDYGARTVRALPGLDEAEGRMVAEWLGKRLPPGAVG